jgi:hypothetical protein
MLSSPFRRHRFPRNGLLLALSMVQPEFWRDPELITTVEAQMQVCVSLFLPSFVVSAKNPYAYSLVWRYCQTFHL